MTEILVGIIALVPAVLGLLDRRRQTSALEAEIRILNSLPSDMNAARRMMRHEVRNSVSRYTTRRRRLIDAAVPFLPLVAYCFALVGLNLLTKSSVRDVVEPARLVGGEFAIGVAVVLLLLFAVRIAKPTLKLLKLV